MLSYSKVTPWLIFNQYIVSAQYIDFPGSELRVGGREVITAPFYRLSHSTHTC